MSKHSSAPVRRPSSMTVLPRASVPTAPISYLLLSALSIAATRTWIIGSQDGPGSELILIASYWAWQLGSELRERWRRRNSRKVLAGSKIDLMAATCVSLQSVSFLVALRSTSPLRVLILLFASWTIPHISSLVELYRSLPVLLAAAGIVVNTMTGPDASPKALISIGALCTSTAMTSMLRLSRSEAKTESKLRQLSICAIFSSAWCGVFLFLGLMSLPVLDLGGPNHLLGTALAGAVTRFWPVKPISSSGPSSSIFQSAKSSAILIVAGVAIQGFALPPRPSLLDVVFVLPLTLTSLGLFMGQAFSPSRKLSASWTFHSAEISTKARWTAMRIIPATWRPHLQTILRTPTSSRIFYFLLLNLVYMAVQMVYGVLTNSLGLISDAIHMLFDCLGLGVGLWASVAATWKPDGRYTYGYSRVETLSGFANGCFLILVSVFIIMEAVQRILSPPEMKTNQVLLVSSIGLAINLWGMYATGGHHHHGHHHGDDHDHSHGHAHGHTSLPVIEKKVDHRHENSFAHHHDASGGPRIARKRSSQFGISTSSASHDPTHPHEHHSPHKQEHDHDHNHNHDHCNDHSHSHLHDHDHEDDHHHHSHTEHVDEHAHAHSHSHSHNMRGVFLHVLADTLGSVGVILSTIMIRLTGWTVFDPIASLMIAGLIMASVIPLVIDSAKVLCLDVGTEAEADVRAALSELSSIDGLAHYSAPRFWPRCEGELVGSIHIQLAPSAANSDPSRGPSFTPGPRYSGDTIYANAEKVLSRVEKALKGRIRGLSELVVQIEGAEERTFCGCMTGGSS